MNDSRTTAGRKIRTAIVVLFFVAIALVVATPILTCAGVAMFGIPVSDRFRDVVADPGGDFTQYTGLEWPSTASIISVEDTHGGFHGDGEFHIIFDTDRGTLERWLAKPPPSDQAEWEHGPVPTEIGLHCSFGSSGVASVTVDGGPSEYSGNPELERVLSAKEIRYAAKERCCESLRWHNGNLLVIDLANNRVWLSIWDL